MGGTTRYLRDSPLGGLVFRSIEGPHDEGQHYREPSLLEEGNPLEE
jgi:hypothetical protein